MKLMSIFSVALLLSLSSPAKAVPSYYKEILKNKPAIEQAYAERNKNLGLSPEQFKTALEKYYDYRSEKVKYSEVAQNAAIAGSNSYELHKTESPNAEESLKEYIKLQNLADMELAGVLEIQVANVKRFKEAAAYVEYLHKNSKKKTEPN